MVAGKFGGYSIEAGWAGKVAAVCGAFLLAAASYMILENMTSAGSRKVASSDNAPAMTMEALKRLSPGERADAQQAARRAFVRNTLDAGAVMDLSLFAEADGNMEAAERLKLSAGEMTPRVTKIQAESLAIFLKRRDFTQVMGRLDGLIRARPSEAENFFALAAEISADPEGANAVARMLTSEPPWRAAFFRSLVSKGHLDIATRIMDDIHSLGSIVEDSELAAVINAYLNAGGIDKAYSVWLASLSEAELRDVKRIYDGGFTHPIRSLRFDWTVRPANGFTYRLTPRNTASMDQVLQFDFVNFPGTFANLSQILRLRPGQYRLSGEVRFDSFESPAGMIFRLYCLDGGRPRGLAATSPLPKSSQWTDFEQDFQVPETGCLNQILQLESQFKLDKLQFTRGMIVLGSIDIDKRPDLAQ